MAVQFTGVVRQVRLCQTTDDGLLRARHAGFGTGFGKLLLRRSVMTNFNFSQNSSNQYFFLSIT
jgi:hypothetical protein